MADADVAQDTPAKAETTPTAGGLPSTMKAWIVTKNGEPKDALTLKHDQPVPTTPKGTNILIKVQWAALNPADVNFMATLPNWLPFRRNPIVGLDFAGTVVKIGPSVPVSAEVKVGDEVCGALNVMSVAVGKGSLAEYVEVPVEKVATKPKGLGAKEAAGALGTAGQTAFIMMREADVREGDRVLVNGASGGVGSILVQAAKAKGAVVYGVCSKENGDMVKRLGADETIDYKEHKLPDYLATGAGFDAAERKGLHKIFDCVGDNDLFRQSTKYLDPKGVFITIVGGVGVMPMVWSKTPAFLGGTVRRFKLLALFPDGPLAKEAGKCVEEGAWKHFPIDSEYTMDDALQGYERVFSKRSKGKVVVKVAKDDA